MANKDIRIVIPIIPDNLIYLAEKIIVKHESDAENSPLGILNMADMKAQTLIARAKDTEAEMLNRNKEKAFEARDNALVNSGIPTVDYYVKASRDILLGYYKGSETMLGDHGFEVRQSSGKIKIFIPASAKQLIELAGLILAKHNADGENSALRWMNIADFTEKYTVALTQQETATKLNRDKIAAYAERNRVLGIALKQLSTTKGTVRFYVSQVRDVLLGLHKGNEFGLGDWGFTVHHGRKHASHNICLHGLVTDQNGKAVKGAVLTMVQLNVSVKSNTNGKYRFRKQTAGTYDITINKVNFAGQIIPEVNINDTEAINLDFKLIPLPACVIANITSRGQALADAVLRIEGLDMEAVSGLDGISRIDGIPPGTYQLIVSAAGKITLTRTVTLVANGINSLNFDLIPFG